MLINEIAAVPSTVPSLGIKTEYIEDSFWSNVDAIAAEDTHTNKLKLESGEAKNTDDQMNAVYQYIMKNFIQDNLQASNALDDGTSDTSMAEDQVYSQYSDYIAKEFVGSMGLNNLMASGLLSE